MFERDLEMPNVGRMRLWWRLASPAISGRAFNELVRVRHCDLLSSSQGIESDRPASQLAAQQRRRRVTVDAGVATCGPTCGPSCSAMPAASAAPASPSARQHSLSMSAPDEDRVVSESDHSRENDWEAPATPALDPADRWDVAGEVNLDRPAGEHSRSNETRSTSAGELSHGLPRGPPCSAPSAPPSEAPCGPPGGPAGPLAPTSSPFPCPALPPPSPSASSTASSSPLLPISSAPPPASISAPLSAQQLVFHDLKGVGKGQGKGRGKGTGKNKGKGTGGPDDDDDDGDADDDDDDNFGDNERSSFLMGPNMQPEENEPLKGKGKGKAKSGKGKGIKVRKVRKERLVKAEDQATQRMVETRAEIQMISYPLLQISPVQIGTFLTR